MAFSLTSQHRDVFFDHFGERVIYKPRSGAPRSITVVVDRQAHEAIGEIPGRSRPLPLAVVTAKNDEILGIVPEKLATGDKLSLPDYVGGASVDRIIGGIITQDEGIVEIEVR